MKFTTGIPDLYKKLILIICIIAFIYLFGTLGYLVLEDNYSLLDALYMTAITLATVGFHEVGQLHDSARIFTIVLIVLGISTLGYSVSSITSLIVEGHVRNTFRNRKMEKNINKMKGHVILCGHGRLGGHAAQELEQWNQQFVVIEHQADIAESLREKGTPCIHGNAVEDDILISAGVERAKGLIAALAEDTDNLFVTLTARRINKDLEIVARANYESSENKLIAAGANRVILPTKIAGRRMACMLAQPEVATFLDVVVETADMDLSLQEIEISRGSKLDGVLISEANMPHQIRIIGLKIPGERMIVNPTATHKLEAHQKIVVLGLNTEIDKYREII